VFRAQARLVRTTTPGGLDVRAEVPARKREPESARINGPRAEARAAVQTISRLHASQVQQAGAHGGTQASWHAKGPVFTGPNEYRYRDSNPGFRHERAAS
jgi:hypothetical protein